MSEESTTPDLVELTRHAFAAASRHDLDTLMGFIAPEAVYDLSDLGIGTFDGAAAIRSFIEDWWGTWGEHLVEAEEMVDLGHGVVFCALGKTVASWVATVTSNSGGGGSFCGRGA